MGLYNLFYEFFTVCTSILARDSRGQLLHARNLDFGIFLGYNTNYKCFPHENTMIYYAYQIRNMYHFAGHRTPLSFNHMFTCTRTLLRWDFKNDTWLLSEKLRALAVNVEFVRGGRTLYYSTQLAGYLGLLTALKPVRTPSEGGPDRPSFRTEPPRPRTLNSVHCHLSSASAHAPRWHRLYWHRCARAQGAYSLTVNERFSLDGGFIGIIEWMRGMRQQQWNAGITRAAFELDETYQQAK